MFLADIRQRIDAACKNAARDPSTVTLVAVTKSRTAQDIAPFLAAGHIAFGENKVQEAQEKWPPLKEKYKTELHFIGHLQTNKCAAAVALFDVIQTVDREKLALELAREMEKQKRRLPCYIQVNTGEEEQKGGIAPQQAESFYRFCTEEVGLDIQGLMCIPPEEDIPDMHFALLHKIARTLNLKSLSMGMSSDFEIAIRYGASHVRIGNALFEKPRA